MRLDDDDFALFGLPQRFAQERAQIDARWRALQAEAHPDRFVSEGAAAQRVAMQWAMRINQAHQRLKNPLQRGAYLCELRGAPVDAERNTAMPAEFLVQQMQWREALDEATDARAVDQLEHTVAGHEQTLLEALRTALDERHDAPAAAQQVRALMFIARFRDDIRRRQEAMDA